MLVYLLLLLLFSDLSSWMSWSWRFTREWTMMMLKAYFLRRFWRFLEFWKFSVSCRHEIGLGKLSRSLFWGFFQWCLLCGFWLHRERETGRHRESMWRIRNSSRDCFKPHHMFKSINFSGSSSQFYYYYDYYYLPRWGVQALAWLRSTFHPQCLSALFPRHAILPRPTFQVCAL